MAQSWALSPLCRTPPCLVMLRIARAALRGPAVQRCAHACTGASVRVAQHVGAGRLKHLRVITAARFASVEAAEAEAPAAATALRDAARGHRGTDFDVASAVARAVAGRGMGTADAVQLGRACLLGDEEQGITQNLDVAVPCLVHCAEAGDADAQFWLGYFYYAGGFRAVEQPELGLEDDGMLSAESALVGMGKGAVRGGEEGADGAPPAPSVGEVNEQAKKAVLRQIRRLTRANRKRLARGEAPSLGEAEAAVAESPEASEASEAGSVAEVSSPAHARREAERLLTQAAKQGHTEAALLLGNMFMEDEPPLVQLAVSWYTRAATAPQPHPDALFNLGRLHYEGLGVPQDRAKALPYFQRAAELGDATSKFFLGHVMRVGVPEAGVRPSRERALGLIEGAAHDGHPGAVMYMAQVYRSGLPAEDGQAGVPADAEKMWKYLDAAVEADHADALFMAADMLVAGEEVPPDVERARLLLERAAEQNHTPSMCLLATLHLQGVGVEEDSELAFRLFERAAVLGSRFAWMNVAQMYSQGVGVPRSTEAAEHIMRLVREGKLGREEDEIVELPEEYRRQLGGQ